jgi:signal transduction histidine kinase
MKKYITKQPSKINFTNAGYFAIGLLLLAFLGFWKSHFSQFFDSTASFNIYFHFHAVIAISWIGLLSAQTILIRNKNFVLHRSLGKPSYVLIPLIFISVSLLAHSRINQEARDAGPALWIPFEDLLLPSGIVTTWKFMPVG